MLKDYIFTSESVTEGHPDKIADQISDAVLDAMLAQDPKSRVACETLITTGLVVLAGEVTTNQGFKSVVPKPEIGTPFVYFFLKNTLPVIEGMASGSTFKEVSGSTMKNVPAVIPDAETLAKFSDFCAPIFAQQRILEEQNQSLATLRDNLLPKLMSGEIDVSAIQL